MGHDSRQALDSCGLPADLFQAPGTAQAPLSAYFRLCEYVCVRAGDETLRVSQRPLLVGASDLVQARLHDCRTVEQALNAVATVYNILHGSKYNLVQRRAGQIAYIIDDSGFPYAPGHDAQFVMFTLECLLVLLHVILASMAEAPLAPHALRTRRPPAQGHQPHLDYWGTDPLCSGFLCGFLLRVRCSDSHRCRPQRHPVRPHGLRRRRAGAGAHGAAGTG
ncbi:AraC family transcriptional regulator ligand-binding domain-containing protein [Hankyongella ginsenosidimutans]